MFIELHISILEWFLNNHVTLKPAEMTAENSFAITVINYTLNCIDLNCNIKYKILLSKKNQLVVYILSVFLSVF